MIRQFTKEDSLQAFAIHRANGLPDNCMPEFYTYNEKQELVPNPLLLIKAVHENGHGKPSMMAFVKITGELFLLLDHTVGTPEERWEWLNEFKDWMANEAWKNGLEQISAWVPPEMNDAFGPRLEEMGFVRSPYVCWTLNL